MKKAIVLLLLSLSTLLVISQDKHQCTAITKAGTQCMNKTTSKYCKTHDKTRSICGAKTKAGGECQTRPKDGGKCWRHKKG